MEVKEDKTIRRNKRSTTSPYGPGNATDHNTAKI